MRKLILAAAVMAPTMSWANEYTPLPPPDMNAMRQQQMQNQLDRIEDNQYLQMMRQNQRDTNPRRYRYDD